ncbi:MAG TPA: WD40 repeat domain-containing protein, partial [Acidimicrobiia bacterium]
MTARDVNAFVLVVFLALGLVFQTALPAQGCSCMMPDPYGGLAEADGAFVGTLLEVDRGVAPITNSGQLIDFRFEVEAALKGEIGDEIVVKSAADGASCGLELPVGERAGFLLTLDNGEWNGNLCWTIDPDALLAAAEGPPEPVQGSPPHLIVFSQMGDAGVIALDRQGEIVGYGEGPQPSLVSACPDDETFIGLTPDNSIRVWSFTDLAVVGEYHLDPDIAPWFNHLICTGPGGNPILGTSTLSGIDRTTLIRHADGVTEALREDVEWLIATSRGPVAIGSDGSILSVDANSGDLKELAEPLGDVHGQLTAVVPSPDGSHLAIGAVDWSLTPQQGRAFVIDVDNGTSVGIDVECDVYPVWLDNEQISILDSCTSEVPVVYTTDLELVGSGELSPFGYWGWSVTDETGAVFYPGEFGLNVLEPGATTGTQFGHSMGFPSAALLVPETARETWTGSDFVPAAVTDVPIVDEPLPPID